jgi:hypothetical protein
MPHLMSNAPVEAVSRGGGVGAGRLGGSSTVNHISNAAVAACVQIDIATPHHFISE